MPDSFFSSSNTTQGQSSGQTQPWAAQQPYLTYGFGQAQNIYQSQANTPFYQGELYAGLNPQQMGALQGLNNYASGGGSNVANTLTSTGNSAVGGVSNAANDAQSIYNKTQQDPTQQVVNDAGQFVNNDLVNRQIAAATRPIEQQLNEVEIPGSNISASATGNANSSRTGVEQAIMRRNAGTQEGDIAAQIEGNAYNTGVNAANSLYGTNLYGALSAANSELGAGSTGAGLLSQGYNTTLNNLNIPLQTGTLQQQNQQGLDEEGLARYEGNLSQPWQTLNNYWGIVGNTNWGNQTNSQTTGEATNHPSGVQDIGSILGLIGSDPRMKVIEDGKVKPKQNGVLYRAPSNEKFKMGVRYRDAKGNRAIYRGNGQWQELANVR